MTFIKSLTIFGFNIFYSYKLENDVTKVNSEILKNPPFLIGHLYIFIHSFIHVAPTEYKEPVYIPEIELDAAT